MRACRDLRKSEAHRRWQLRGLGEPVLLAQGGWASLRSRYRGLGEPGLSVQGAGRACALSTRVCVPELHLQKRRRVGIVNTTDNFWGKKIKQDTNNLIMETLGTQIY